MKNKITFDQIFLFSQMSTPTFKVQKQNIKNIGFELGIMPCNRCGIHLRQVLLRKSKETSLFISLP